MPGFLSMTFFKTSGFKGTGQLMCSQPSTGPPDSLMEISGAKKMDWAQKGSGKQFHKQPLRMVASIPPCNSLSSSKK